MASATPLKISSGVIAQYSSSDTIPVGNLGTGTPTSAVYLRGDGAWAAAGGGGGSSFTYAASAPSSPVVGDEWVNSNTGIKYTYINDGDSNQWVELGGSIEFSPSGITTTKAVSLFDPVALDSVTMFYTPSAVTLNKLITVCTGTGPSVTYTIRYGSSKDSGTEIITGGLTSTSVTTGDITTSFTNSTVPANNYVWLQVATVGGTVKEFHANLNMLSL